MPIKPKSQALAKARDDLAAYAVAVYGKFEMPPHLELLVETLEAVERGEIDRVLISCPPRHGKSLLVSTIFPAWFLAKHPDRHVIASSYSQELASEFGRRVNSYSHDPIHKAIWPDAACRVSDFSDAAHRFDLAGGGGYRAIGALGSITGRGAHVMILDDLVKGHADANSPTHRKSLKNWYQSVAYERLEPSGATIVISTRWNQDDLHGWLLREHADESWVAINLPALAEPQDIVGRAEGDALWPARFNLKALERIRAAIGSQAWLSFYKGRPVAEGGNVFHRDWFRPYGGPIECLRTIFAIDSAVKTGTQNDYSVVTILSEARDGIYVRLVSRGKWEFPELKHQVAALAEIWRPNAILIEDASSGSPLVQSFREDSRLPILAVRPQGSKEVRAAAVSPMCESGRVCVPVDAPWFRDWIEEIVAFPNGTHDDQCDSLALGLSYLRVSGFDSATFQAMGARQAQLNIQRQHRIADFGSGGHGGNMIMNAATLEAIEDGAARRRGVTISGSCYTLAGKFGRGGF